MRGWNHCSECDRIFYSIGDYLCKQCRERLEAELAASKGEPMDDFDFEKESKALGCCPEGSECLRCGNDDIDSLIWNEETGTVTCMICDTEYIP